MKILTLVIDALTWIGNKLRAAKKMEKLEAVTSGTPWEDWKDDLTYDARRSIRNEMEKQCKEAREEMNDEYKNRNADLVTENINLKDTIDNLREKNDEQRAQMDHGAKIILDKNAMIEKLQQEIILLNQQLNNADIKI